MQLIESKARRFAPVVLIGTLLVQIVTHLAWLPISTQVGQLAIPYLMSRGMTLYGNLIENRPPASAALISLLFRLLPSVDPVLIVRMLNLLLMLGLTLLIFALTQRLSRSSFAGICAVLFWFLWEPVYGNLLFYFDSLVGAVFALTVYVWLITEQQREQRAWVGSFLCGLLLGGATVIKQPAWAGMILFALYLFFVVRRWRQLPFYILGVLVFPLLTLAIIAAQGNLDTYLYWNFTFHLFSGIPTGQPLTGNFIRKLLLTNILAPAFVLLALREHRKDWLLVALLWFAGGATLFPNFAENYVMGHIPLLAVMSGIVIASFLKLRDWRKAEMSQVLLAGVAAALAFGWVWTTAVLYVPGPLGRAGIPAYDEFKPLAARIAALSRTGDTLFVLPEFDGNSQLHALTGLLPPGTWVNGHRHILAAPGIVDQLLDEWAKVPPTLIVDFPDFYLQPNPGLVRLKAFLDGRYTEIAQVDDVLFNGDAVIYRLNEASQ
jgi:hypothetical protein